MQNGSGQNVSTEESSAQLNNDVIQGDNKPSTTHLEQSDNLNNSQITGNTLDQTQSLTNNESNELENETNTLATNTILLLSMRTLYMLITQLNTI